MFTTLYCTLAKITFSEFNMAKFLFSDFMSTFTGTGTYELCQMLLLRDISLKPIEICTGIHPVYLFSKFQEKTPPKFSKMTRLFHFCLLAEN